MAELDTHPYLKRQGFADLEGLVHPNGLLLIPMLDWRTNEIINVQRINAHGDKKYLKGARAGYAVHRLGRGLPTWYVEGYATGLAVRHALRLAHQKDSVTVTFSAGNLEKVAGQIGYVVADNDALKTSEGERVAVATKLPWWMPPKPGTDALDYMRDEGEHALRRELMRLKAKARR